MRNYSMFPSLLFLQEQNSGFSQNPTPDPSMSLEMCTNMNDIGSHFSLHAEALQSNQPQLSYAGSVFSSGLSYFTPAVANSSASMNSLISPTIYQCSSSNAEKEKHFGQPFQSDFLRDPRKRPFEEFASRDGISGVISRTIFPNELRVSKRKAIKQSVDTRALKMPTRRSQKLSDKITTLQKVVSPYGKTDTVSVLQETYMYIKIAHQEIQRLTLSCFGARSLNPELMYSNAEKWYPNLKSRGLCLVPLSNTNRLPAEDTADCNLGVPKIMNSWRF